MKKILVFMLTFVLAATASAQVKVTGRVIDLQNKPVSDVIVKLVSGTKTLAFTSTNARGEYNLEVKNAPTGERLRVLCKQSEQVRAGEQSSGMVTLQFTHPRGGRLSPNLP